MGLFDFVGDIFGGGSAAAPPQIMSTQDLLGQTYGALQSTVPGVLAYNQALAPGLTDIQLGVQNQIFGPAANKLQQNTYQSILDQLNLGSQLPADVQQQVIQNALQSSGMSGFGVSPGGRGLVARDLGLTSLDLLNQRQNLALGAVNQLPLSHYQYQPSGFMTPQDIAGDIRGVQAQQQQNEAMASAQKSNAFSNLFKTGLQIAGTVAGGFFGGPVGAMAGGALGTAAGGLFGGGSGGGSAIGGPGAGIGSAGGSSVGSIFGSFLK